MAGADVWGSAKLGMVQKRKELVHIREYFSKSFIKNRFVKKIEER